MGKCPCFFVHHGTAGTVTIDCIDFLGVSFSVHYADQQHCDGQKKRNEEHIKPKSHVFLLSDNGLQQFLVSVAYGILHVLVESLPNQGHHLVGGAVGGIHHQVEVVVVVVVVNDGIGIVVVVVVDTVGIELVNTLEVVLLLDEVDCTISSLVVVKDVSVSLLELCDTID